MIFCVFHYYKWVYIFGAILTFSNAMFINNKFLLISCLVIMYCILFFKGIHILKQYKKTRNTNQSIPKKIFDTSYRIFRSRVALFWLAFIVLCYLGKFVFQISHQYFYCLTFFFLFLDKFFVNVVCLLQKFSDPTGKIVLCCCGCPCRGWDMMLIHTPLLFALNQDSLIQNLMIIISSILAVLSLIQWEIHKYHLVEIRPKCSYSCDLKLCREHQNN